MLIRIWALTLLFCLSSFAAVVSAGSMRCGNRVVSIGDATAEVLSKCGEPAIRELVALKSLALETRFQLFDTEKTVVETEQVEMWIYNQGVGTFLKILRFVGGRLASIESGDRVVSPGPRLVQGLVSLGDTKVEVLQTVGEPALREDLGFRLEETVRQLPDPKNRQVVSVTEKVERWTFYRGPGRFLQMITFRGGRVVRIEYGERQ